MAIGAQGEFVLDEQGTWLVSIEGAVYRPGNYRVQPGTKLLRVLKAAGLRSTGGPPPYSALYRIACTVLVDGRWKYYEVNTIKDPEPDLLLSDGAKIRVPELADM